MALVLANRVQESGTANTTVSFTLTGAVAGFQTFATIGDTNTTYYAATDASGNWEVGLGTYSTTGPTLTRTTVYASSNSGSAVTFSGAVNVFVTYPSGRSVNLDASGNVSALGTVASGTWQGTTVGVAYGGTGVTSSSGANSVMLRDANQNVAVNRLNQSNTSTAAAGGTTALTAASSYSQTLTGTGNQTYTMPDATTLTTGVAFVFNNNATGTLTLQDYATGSIGTITSGGAVELVLLSNGTTAGTWDVHGYIPENVTWGTNALNLGSTIITGGTWNGGTIPTGYGGTGLTTFTSANNALYSTSASALAAGTLPVTAGGTGNTTGQAASLANALTIGTGLSGTSYNGSAAITIANTGVTSIAGTSPVTASASTGSVTMSLASGYGDTQNPYASKTANYFLAAPNGGAGVPTFRAVVAADIPTLNQNTTGSAATLTTARAIYGNNFDGSAALTQIIASTYGGTGNGFTKFSGATTTEKTYTLPDATCSILTSNTAVTVAQGGTGQTTYTDGQLLIGNTTGNTLTKATLTAGTAISVTNGGGSITIANTGVTSAVAGSGISVSGATGAVTITNSGVTSITGTANQITASASTGGVTLSTPQSIGTASSVQFGSFGVGTAASGTTGEIRATNNITAYYSDIRLKTKIGDIVDPLGKVRQIKTMIYHANETAVGLGYDASVIEVGVSAQSVQAVQPEAVAPAPIDEKYLTVRYERLVPLLLESIKTLENRIIELETKLKG